MKIGIIGSGAIGGSLGLLWAKAGHDVMFSSRHPEELKGIVESAGPTASAGTPDQAISSADVLLEAIPYKAALDLPAEALAGKILLTASNYYPQRDGEIDLDGSSQTELLARKLPEARIVKAFNMMFAAEMQARVEGPPDREIAIFYAGDDEEAKRIAEQLIREAQFAPVDAGTLAEGAAFESGGPLYAQKWSATEAKAKLAALRAEMG